MLGRIAYVATCTIAAIGMTGLAVASLSGPSYAQSANCAPREIVEGTLNNTYGEIRQSIALDGGMNIIETWANPETGTWSITVSPANGMTCLVASGEYWEYTGDVPLPPMGEEM